MIYFKIFFNDRNIYYNVVLNNDKEDIVERIKSLFPESIQIEETYLNDKIIIKPNSNFKTAFSDNVLNIFNRIGINDIVEFNKHKIYTNEDNIEYDILLEEKQINVEKLIINNELDIKNYIEDIEPIEDIESIEDINYNSFIDLENKELLKNISLEFDAVETVLYKNLFREEGRLPRYIELFDLYQSNSEHSRHWFFNGKLELEGNILGTTLFKMVKSTLQESKNTQKGKSNSLVAFSDNSSVIRGYSTNNLYIRDNKPHILNHQMDCVFTAETHNFPTLICPFEGAATGIGGRIRDNQATGKGANIIAGTAGYCVGNISEYDDKIPFKKPIDILIEASNGASDYGNKIGEPIINGFTRSFGINLNKRIEFIKPIMFTGGIGSMERINIYKDKPRVGDLIIRIGGPVYKIGLGGGFASSVDQDSDNKSSDLSAVQRGNPQMCNKLNRVIRGLSEDDDNIIISIHDQGAGGLANVVKEIIYPLGGVVNLKNVTLGDPTLNPLEIWCSEFQESNLLIIKSSNLDYLKSICSKENIYCDNMGTITDTERIVVNHGIEEVYDLPLEPVLEPLIKKKYNLTETLEGSEDIKNYHSKFNNEEFYLENDLISETNLNGLLLNILLNVDISSKRFLTNKVDRSVTGLIAQQQCVGPFHTPLSNYGLVALSMFDKKGIVSAVGERPIYGLMDSKSQATMSVGEMLTNIMGVYIGDIRNIKCSGNWMWAIKENGESKKLYETCKYLCECLIKMGVAIDGGKDSLSMSVKYKDDISSKNNINNINSRNIIKETVIKSPGNIVVSGYCSVENIYKKVTPNFKQCGSNIILLQFNEKYRKGCGILDREFNMEYLDPDCPIFEETEEFIKCFNLIQTMIKNDKISSLHDRSDGGLICTLTEMSISSNIGAFIDLNGLNLEKENNEISNRHNLINTNFDIMDFLFSEELGIVIELEDKYLDDFYNEIENTGIKYINLGKTTEEKKLIVNRGTNIIDLHINKLSEKFEYTSYQLEKKQCNNTYVEEEYLINCNLKEPKYYLPNLVLKFCQDKKLNYFNFRQYMNSYDHIYYVNRPTIGIIREEGSNGDREMIASFKYVGFDIFDLHMNDLIKNPKLIRKCRGLIYVGGFSHGDVLGSGYGWYLTIQNNSDLRIEMDLFYKNKNTFSFGVCNGFQLMVRQDIFSTRLDINQKIRLKKNNSERFESRFSNVKIVNDNNIFFKGMKDMVFGVWVAHGEGRLEFGNLEKKQKILQYVDSEGNPTLTYPYNPNGSMEALAGICSTNGRHLGMMPHPERSFLKYHLPYTNNYDISNSPWLFMFNNIFNWCVINK